MSENHASYVVTYANEKAFKGAIKNELRRLAETDSSSYKGPEPCLVRAWLQYSGWQCNEVSDFLRVNTSTVRRWVANREQAQSREMPYSAWALLLAATGHTDIKTLVAV